MTEKLENISKEIRETSNRDVGSGRVKYLVFDLMDENYGVPLHSVKEVTEIFWIVDQST